MEAHDFSRGSSHYVTKSQTFTTPQQVAVESLCHILKREPSLDDALSDIDAPCTLCTDDSQCLSAFL